MKKGHSRHSLITQVDRLQAELDRLRDAVTSFDPNLPPEEMSAVWIRAILEARRRRDLLFGSDIFSDPAWDILLELYAVELGNERATITDVCTGAAVPGTTGLRWVGQLERAGLIVKGHEGTDRRRVYVRLSSRGVAAMKKYFSSSQSTGVAV